MKILTRTPRIRHWLCSNPPWLASAGGLFRTKTVTPDDLANLPDYLEMTKLAFRLALTHKVARLDIPTFVIHESDQERAWLETLSDRFAEHEYRLLPLVRELIASPLFRQAGAPN